jgi:PAS domain S-box-containing protein
MESRSVEWGTDSVESLRRRLEESQRLVRMLDAQVHVLERERQKLAAVVGHGDVGFLVVDASLRIVWTNEFFATRLRTPSDPPSFVGSFCHRTLCRRDLVCEGCPATAAFESEATAHRELNLNVDGNARILYVTAIPVLSPKGSVEQLMIMVQDVSDLEVLRRSERRLRESESRLRLLVEQMPAVMWSTDRELRFTSSVGSALKDLGLRANEVVGQSLFDFFRTDDPEFPPIAAHLRAVAGSSMSYEMSWKGRSFDTYVEPLFGGRREIIGSVGLALDVTERRTAEHARRQSEARKHAILETSLDAIVIMDHEGRVVEFNPAAEKTFGYERSEVLGRILAEVIIPARLREAHREGPAQFLTTNPGDIVGRRIESIAMRKDGSELPVELAITRILLDGPPTFAGHIRDLTDRKQAESELRERDEQLRQAQRMEAIGTLAGGVAHDFNNILTAILGYTGLLKRFDPRLDGVQKAADVMEKAAKRGALLTQQLLGFARKGKNESAAVDLAVIVEEVDALLQRTIEKSIVIRRTSEPESVVVIGDPGQLHQVVLNLAVNSRDAMPDGGELRLDTTIVQLSEDDCRRHPGTSPGAYVRLSVTDTGCGIDESVRGRIFEPFFTTKELGKGTGMGLAMVYGIVRNHGGAITVRSEVGSGTTIEILLPHAAAATPAEVPHRTGLAVPGNGRILVVDDEDGVREVAADLLSCLGYDVTTAPDGIAAVTQYQHSGHEIDVVLLDLAMPGMDGGDCFRALKAIDRDVKAILCTGYGFNVAAQQLLDEGMLAIVSKPYGIEQLSDAIVQAMQLTKGGPRREPEATE